MDGSCVDGGGCQCCGGGGGGFGSEKKTVGRPYLVAWKFFCQDRG